MDNLIQRSLFNRDGRLNSEIIQHGWTDLIVLTADPVKLHFFKMEVKRSWAAHVGDLGGSGAIESNPRHGFIRDIIQFGVNICRKKTEREHTDEAQTDRHGDVKVDIVRG